MDEKRKSTDYINVIIEGWKRRFVTFVKVVAVVWDLRYCYSSDGHTTEVSVTGLAMDNAHIIRVE